MRERPILFNGAMVRAILAGQKTQTRRAVKPAPQTIVNGKTTPWEGDGAALMTMLLAQQRGCPFGQPGDRLWVRERFKPVASGQVKDGYGEVRYGYAYEADSSTRWNRRTTVIHDMTGQPNKGPMQFQQCPWKSAICMPHRARRLVLEVTAVRVERLQAISAQDCIAEGITTRFTVDDGNDDLRIQFRDLWTSTGGDWDGNPWVWVIEFNRINEATNG